MRTLLLGLVLASGCVVHAVGGVEPAFADHIDPTIAEERRASWTPIALRWPGHYEVISIGFDHYERWLASITAADRIPDVTEVTETVPEDVLDRLDAQRL